MTSTRGPTSAAPMMVPAGLQTAADVGVIGSVNLDTIQHADGRVVEAWGGVLFTACALAHLGGGRLRPWLFAHVGAALHERLQLQLAATVPALRLAGVTTVPGGGFRCRIQYDAMGHKTEVLSGGAPPLRIDEVGPYLGGLRGLLVNSITGYELELDTLRAVRRGLAGPLLMDVHSLTLGRRADGSRYERAPDDWREWVAQADVVQLNAAEAAILGAGATDAAGLTDFACSLLDLGPRWAVVTRGADGSVAACRQADGSTRRLHQAAVDVDAPGRIDPTGCGDVYLAGLAVGLLRGRELQDAMALASRAAARNCALSGIDDLHRLAVA